MFESWRTNRLNGQIAELTAVHKHFDSQRVNKANAHKEFFAIRPCDAIEALRDEFHVDIHFVNEQEEDEE